MTRPPVVLIGLDCPTGLQAARTFAARQIEVIGIASNVRHPCVRTRSCRQVIEVEAGESQLVEALMRLGVRLGERAVLVPCADLAVLAVSKHQAELNMLYRFAVPTIDITAMLLDKALFAKFATIHEFPIPRTFVISGPGDIETAGGELEYPCVLKPSVKSPAWSANTTAKAIVVDSPRALAESYTKFSPWADAFVVQEWIAGGDEDHYTCDCYVSGQGVPLVTFTARKIRQWPPGTGQGCLSVECRDDYVRDLTLRVLATAGHHGQGYLETKRDTRSGRHLIVEANIGRPTGRVVAAERGGVELLMTMYCDLVGAPLPAERTQKYVGTKWIHVRRDLQASAHLMLTRRASLRDVVKPWKGPFAFALLSRRDPVPFVADFLHAIGQAAGPAWETARERLARRSWLRWLRPTERIETEEARGDESRQAVPALARAEQADFDVQGVVRVRTRDAWPADLAAVARHLGRAAKPLAGDPDVIVCFVDELTPRVLEHVDGDIAFGDDGVYVMDRVSGRVLGHMRLSEPWGSALIVCRRGLGYVPLLSTAFDLAALHHEWIPLRAGTWRVRDTNVLVVPGRASHLAAERGGVPCLRPVPDGRLLLSPEVRTIHRMGKPAPLLGTSSVDAPWERANASDTRPDAIVLLEPHDRADISVERIDSEAAAGRIAAGVGAETRARLAHRDAPSGQLAGRGWLSARRAPGVATRLLREATRWKPCYAIAHPEPCSPDALADAIARALPEGTAAAEHAHERRSPDAPRSKRKPRRSADPAASEKSRGEP